MDYRMFLLDTNVCAAAIKGDRLVLGKLQLYAGRIYLPFIVAAELSFGVEKRSLKGPVDGFRITLKRFMETVDGVVEMTKSVIPVYAELRARLESRGLLVGAHDLWIAAQAITEEAVLVTANIREFERIPGLKLQNWIES